MFDCDKCGLCCISLNICEATAYLHNGDGICNYLDQETMLCRIYDERPIFCRVDDYYEEFLSDKMEKEEFLHMNYEACKLKKKQWEECGRDIHKMAWSIPDMGKERETIIRESMEKIGKAKQ